MAMSAPDSMVRKIFARIDRIAKEYNVPNMADKSLSDIAIPVVKRAAACDIKGMLNLYGVVSNQASKLATDVTQKHERGYGRPSREYGMPDESKEISEDMQRFIAVIVNELALNCGLRHKS